MKQYITGFITASCLVTSFFLFVAAQNTEFGDIKVHSISIVNNEGRETIWLGSGEGGNGFLETFNNDLFEGKSLVVWNNGLTIDSFIDRGKVISEKRNDVNYYNPDDIIGDNEFTIINLKKDGIENEGISYNVEMEINGVKGEWIFDTGAESFSIGQRLFKRLVKEGVKYRDLKRTVKTFGVGGESTGRLIIIDDLKIGGYIINNVVVKIANDNNFSLLGMGFLNKFNDVEWSMKKKKLKLIK